MKVILFANTPWYLYNFRLSLAKALRTQGNKIVLVSPPGPYSERLIENGFEWIEFKLDRKGISPIKEALTIIRLIQLYWRERPDIVHHFTIKNVLYGSFAARFLNVPRIINSITGLGYAFSTNAGWIYYVVSLLYRMALKNTKVIFQTHEDLNLFLKKGWVDQAQVDLIRGSGVDINYFTPQPEPDDQERPIVLLPARLLFSKGIKEFMEAGRLLAEQGVSARFVLVGRPDPNNPDSITGEQLSIWKAKGAAEFWGWQDDMLSVYSRATLVCLPSYSEGVPKALLEAAACSRALIASDIPGCQEIVKDGYNGLLVPVKDSTYLARAIRSLLEDPERRHKMGANSRELVVREFSQDLVVQQTLEFYS